MCLSEVNINAHISGRTASAAENDVTPGVSSFFLFSFFFPFVLFQRECGRFICQSKGKMATL